MADHPGWKIAAAVIAAAGAVLAAYVGKQRNDIIDVRDELRMVSVERDQLRNEKAQWIAERASLTKRLQELPERRSDTKPPQPTALNSEIAELEGARVRFTPVKCSHRSVDSSSCVVAIEPLDRDVHLYVWGNANCLVGGTSFLVDSAGKEHKPSDIAMGSNHGYGGADSEMVKNVATPVELVIGEVATSVDRIAKISLTFSYRGCAGPGAKVILRDVPFR